LVNGSGSSALVTVYFNNGDPMVPLVSIGNGVWTGTWRPVTSTTQVGLTADALRVSGTTPQAGQAVIAGSVSAGTPTPAIANVVNAASFMPGTPLSPGSLFAVQGSNLADVTASAASSPYPNLLSGVGVLVGGEMAPLSYVSPSQIIAQIPYDLPTNAQLQIVVQRDATLSVPQQIITASADPGIFTVNQQGTGQGLILRADGVTLAQPGTPANTGEIVIIECTGLGAVSPSVFSGGSSPSSPLSQTVNPATVSIGGILVPVAFSGLAPGGNPGMYQVNAVVPAGVSGDAVPVIVTVAGQASPPVTMAIGANQFIQLASSLNPSTYGQNVVLTATVTPATATGMVVFKDGSTILGSGNLANGVASLTVSSLTAGQHTLTASYTGDSGNNPGTSPSLVQAVNQAPTTTTLTSSANPSAQGQNVTFTATVSSNGGSIPTGHLLLQLGSTPITATLIAGAVSFTLNVLPPGSTILTASYAGDNNNAPSSSAPLNQIVNSITSSCGTQSFSYTIGQSVPPPVNCAFTAVAPALFTVGTSASWLTVTPAFGTLGIFPTTLALGVNPSGLSAGTYAGYVTIAGPQLGSIVVQVQLTVTPAPAPTLIVTPASVSFNFDLASTGPPPTQTLTLSSNGAALPFTVTSVTLAGGNWLTASPASGITPSQLSISANPSSLLPGSYTGSVTVASPGAPAVIVPVTLLVSGTLPPQLSVNTAALNLNGTAHGAPVSANVQVSNAGSSVNFTATTSGGSWLTISPPSGSVAQSAPAVLTVNADPTTLAPGIYQGTVTISGAGSTASIPITFTVSAGNPSILLAQAGINFTAVSMAGSPLPQAVNILNIGTGSLNWTATASTLESSPWLTLSSNSGIIQRPYLDISTVNAIIDPTVLATLQPGNHYGQIQIADANGLAANSPQVVNVILNVLAPGSDPGPEIQPSSLIFTGQAGTSPSAQSVTIGIRKAQTDHYISGLLTNGGFSYSPPQATLQPNQAATLQVTPNFSSATPGLPLRDTITLQFDDGTARTIGLLTVVAPQATTNGRIGPQLAVSCGALTLQWQQPSSSPPSFSVVRGQSQLLEVQVVDSCGNLVGPGNPNTASIQATFSNQDPNVTLVHIGNGVWAGSWTPGNPSAAPVTVQVVGSNSLAGLQQSGSSIQLSATILTGDTPLVTAGGVQNDASQVMGAPIAPGTLITLNGINLANADPSQPATRVFLGGVELPVFSSSSGAANVLIPYDAPVNTASQVTVQVGLIQSMPQQLVVAEAQPAVFTLDGSGSGPGQIYKSDGTTIAQGDTPALVGEMIYIQCTGLGAVTPNIPVGSVLSSDTPAMTVNTATVTINGIAATVVSSGVMPGSAGRYQVAVIVPDGSDAGSATDVPVTVTIKGQVSPPVTIRKPGPRGGTPGLLAIPPSKH
jgi:uncharacterized protein (TIGR03437 family)